MKISIVPSAGKNSITSINAGTSSPRLGGSIDLTNFPSLTSFTCVSNDITACNIANLNNTIGFLNVSDNKLTGNVPSFAGNTNITTINYSTNVLSGTMGSIDGCTKLTEYRVNTNFIDANTGLTGNLPEISACPALVTVHAADCKITGLPLLSSSSLRLLYLYNGTGHNSISHVLSTNSLTGLPAIRQIQIQNQKNQSLSGIIPDFKNFNPFLNSFFINGNSNIRGVVPCTSGTALTDFRAYSCNLSGFTFAPISSAFFVGVAGVPTSKTFRVDSNSFTLTATYLTLSAFYTEIRRLTAAGVSVTTLTGGSLLLNGTKMPALSNSGGGPLNGQIYNLVNYLTASPAPKWTVSLGSSSIRG